MSGAIVQSSEQRCLVYRYTAEFNEAMATDRGILKRLVACAQPVHPHGPIRDRRDVAQPAIAYTGGFSQCMHL
jgi:hypothetical protein